jgi:alkylation response protein AidB-like acyl-CoA dehydrogenase
MLHELTSDQELLRDTTARFLADHVSLATQRKNLREDPVGFAPDYWTQGGELGWCMLLASEQDGGGSVSGRGAVDLSLIAYEFGKHSAPGPLADCNVAVLALSGQDGDLQQQALGEVMMGQAIASSCLGTAPWVFPGESSISIRRDGGDVIIDGTILPVESGAQAGYFLVTGQSEDRGEHGMTQVLVPAGTTGVTVKPLKSIDVTRRFAKVTFEGARLPASALVGEFGQADAAVVRQIQHAAVILSAESVGAMDAAFDMTMDWMFNRYTFGRALASYQALKHRAADMKSWLEASHAISDAAAGAVADGADNAGELASSAKSYIGVQGPELCQEGVQLHGGIGVTYEHDLHFFLRRVTLDALLFGTPAEHRRWLAAMQIKKEKAA